MKSEPTPEKPQPVSLKKTLTLRTTVLFGVGTMLGAGIYAIIGEAAGSAGNMLWASFLVAALVALLTGLSYAEFVSRFPDAGGSFEYIKRSLGVRAGYLSGILIFFTGVVAAAAIAISFAQYLSRLIDTPQWMAVIGIIGFMGAVNVVGMKSSSGFNAVATSITVIGLLAVVIFALPDWGDVELFSSPPGGAVGIIAAASLIFFSYVGFEDLVKMAEEVKEPRKVLPRALLISWSIVVVIYLLIAISSVAVLDWENLADASGPLSAVMEAKAGRVGAIGLAVVALFATSKTILSNILGTSRVLFDMARDGDIGWLKKLTHIVERFGSPVWAIAVVTLVAMGFGLIGNLSIVASVSNVFIMTLFTTVNISLIVWRLRNRDAEPAPFMLRGTCGGVPLIPCFAALTTLILLGFNLYTIVTSGT